MSSGNDQAGIAFVGRADELTGLLDGSPRADMAANETPDSNVVTGVEVADTVDEMR